MARLQDIGAAALEPIKIESQSWNALNLILVGIGVVGLIVALMVIGLDAPSVGIAIGISSLAPLVVGIGDAIRRRLRKRHVNLHEHGIAIVDGKRRLAISFDEMVGLATKAEDLLSNGEVNGMQYSFSIWRDDALAKKPLITLETKFKTGEDGIARFAELLDTLVAERANRMQAALEREEKVRGDSFVVDAGALRVDKTQVALDDIVATGIWDKRACFWKRGESMPVVGLPRENANVTALVALISRRIEERGEEEEDVGGLGRVLFERKAKTAQVFVLGAIAAVVLAGGLICLVLSPFVDLGAGLALVGMGGLVVGFLLGLATYANWRGTFRCHERGVYQRTTFGESSLPYTEVASFTYGATRMYYNGAYTGTALNLKFEPPAGAGQKPIKYNTTVRGRDEDLDALRDHIAGVLANRMVSQIREEGKNVPWMDDTSLDPEGIHFRRRKLIGKGEPAFCPYDKVSGFDVNDGTFYLFAEGEDKPIIQNPVATPNFFPGFFALAIIEGDEEEALAEASTVPEGAGEEPPDVG